MNTIDQNTIKYSLHNKVSLNTFFKGYKNNKDNYNKDNYNKDKYNNKFSLNLILNELFGMVCLFRNYNYIHGNLNVHNIYINTNTFKFYIIDLSNSYILDYNIKLDSTNAENKITKIFFEYWDIFTLYISLQVTFKNDDKTLEFLNGIIESYIKHDTLQNLMREYSEYGNTNILAFHCGQRPQRSPKGHQFHQT